MISSLQEADQLYFGLVHGIVVDNIDPLGQGRVRVTYNWLNESMQTEWCRVCQIYAGDGFGAFFVPEKQSEVILGFVHGAMQIPIVLGSLHNGKDKAPGKREKAPGLNQKMIRTQGKHEIVLDDTDSQKCVQITSSGKQVLVLDDTNKLIRITTGQGQTIVLEQSSNSVTVSTTGGQSVKLDGQGTVTISGPTTVNVQAATVSLQGGKVELGKTAAEKVLLGTQFLALFNTHTHQLGPLPTTPPVVPLTPTVLSTTVTVQQ